MKTEEKTYALLLMQYGGPANPDEVKPFLTNLFTDPYILEVPGFVRTFLGPWLAKNRETESKAIYAEMGGGSTIAAETEAQRAGIEAEFNATQRGLPPFHCDVTMRYMPPFAAEKMRELKDYDVIYLFPLYPQYSRATTGSSLRVVSQALEAEEGNKTNDKASQQRQKQRLIGCYPLLPALVKFFEEKINEGVRQAKEQGLAEESIKVIISAHGLPARMIKKGDPYLLQVTLTAKAIEGKIKESFPDLNVSLAFQSRLGPVKWIEPYTDEVIRAEANESAIIVVPVAFVSEHVETKVELDIEYREIAEEHGAKLYHRVPTPSADKGFIDGLASLVEQIHLGIESGEIKTAQRKDGIEVVSGNHEEPGAFYCDAGYQRCICRNPEAA